MVGKNLDIFESDFGEIKSIALKMLKILKNVPKSNLIFHIIH